MSDPRILAIPDIHSHAKGEHKPFAEERPIPYTARMLFLWFFHAAARGSPRFLMVTDHMNYLTFEDPAAVNLVRRALKLAHAGDLHGAAETAGVDVAHAAVVSSALKRGMRYSIGAEVDNDPRSRPDAQNIVDAMRPDGMIRSVHFLQIDHPEHGAGWNWPFDNPEFVAVFDHVGTEKAWELYMAALLDAVEKLPGHIVGHFYAPAKFGHWPDDKTLAKYEDQLIEACAARGMAIEFNARYIYRAASDEQREKYLAANRRLLRKAREKGVGIAIGSDAHSPKDQGNAFDAIIKVLDDAEINELVFPIGGRLARVALRATKEHLEKKAAATESVVPGSSITGYSRAELQSMNTGAAFAEMDQSVVPPKRRAARTTTSERAVKGSARASAAVARAGAAKAARVAADKKTGKSEAAAAKAAAKTSKAESVARDKAAGKAAKAAAKAPAKAAKAAKPAKLEKAAKPPKAVKAPPAKPAAKKPAPKAAIKGKPAAKKPVPKKPQPKAKPAPPARKAAKPAAKVAAKKPAPARTAKGKPASKAPARKPAPAKKAGAKKPPPKRGR